MDINVEVVFQSLGVLFYGLWMTIAITVISLFIALILGLFTALMKLSKSKILKMISNTYINIIRGTPLLVQVFYVYFALPSLLGFRIDAWTAAITALSLNAGAYIAEVFRSGIQAVSKGQYEAALAQGMTTRQTMQYVILPQAIRIVIPSLLNQFIITLKDTSLVSVIGFEELARKGQIVIATSYAAFEIWTVVALMYLATVLTLTKLSEGLEKRLRIGEY
ncbi:glutamine transporter subunit; membrane component of ABC superfamily [[Clostridium] ultunense Esp]|nr:glutamine transporter subunit; membrane component of ABC superfamily [[Clostridium] ultunense Esp]